MSPSRVYFGNIGFSLGESKKIEELPNLKDEELQKMKDNGLDRYLSSSLTSFELGEESLKKTLSSSNIPPEKIDAVVWQVDDHSSKQENLDSFCDVLVKNNIINATPYGISFTLCSASVMAMQTASSLIKDFDYNNILVVLSYKWDEEKRPYSDLSIFSDGASSFIVSRHTLNYQILNFSITTDLRMFIHEDPSLFTSAHMCSLYSSIRKLLVKSNIEKDAISRVFNFNTNIEFYSSVLQCCGLEENLCYFDNFPKHGHISASDQLINIYDSEKDRPIKKSDIFLLIGTSRTNTVLALLKKIT